MKVVCKPQSTKAKDPSPKRNYTLGPKPPDLDTLTRCYASLCPHIGIIEVLILRRLNPTLSHQTFNNASRERSASEFLALFKLNDGVVFDWYKNWLTYYFRRESAGLNAINSVRVGL